MIDAAGQRRELIPEQFLDAPGAGVTLDCGSRLLLKGPSLPRAAF